MLIAIRCILATNHDGDMVRTLFVKLNCNAKVDKSLRSSYDCMVAIKLNWKQYNMYASSCVFYPECSTIKKKEHIN